jgi:hypothetical protein
MLWGDATKDLEIAKSGLTTRRSRARTCTGSTPFVAWKRTPADGRRGGLKHQTQRSVHGRFSAICGITETPESEMPTLRENESRTTAKNNKHRPDCWACMSVHRVRSEQ